jgi:hypothetical protein
MAPATPGPAAARLALSPIRVGLTPHRKCCAFSLRTLVPLPVWRPDDHDFGSSLRGFRYGFRSGFRSWFEVEEGPSARRGREQQKLTRLRVADRQSTETFPNIGRQRRRRTQCPIRRRPGGDRVAAHIRPRRAQRDQHR